LPRGFSTVVEKALQKEPESRYQRMEQVLDDLSLLRRQVGTRSQDPRTEQVLEDLSLLRRQVDTGSQDTSLSPTMTIAPGARRGHAARWLAAGVLLLVTLAVALAMLPGLRSTLLRAIPHLQVQGEKHPGRESPVGEKR